MVMPDGELVGATVKIWPPKFVVLPAPVAIVIAGPPEDVTSMTGTPLVAASHVSSRNPIK